ncbi:MAG: sulfite exporter TauE/SafE family protein [Anaerovoracaceae bacterium]
MEIFLAYIPFLIALGLAAGFLAGLLGIGGGIILVPGLYFLFKALGYDTALLMHMAIGTSLAVIIPTGISSMLAHNRKGAVLWDVVRAIGPGIVAGVIAGTIIAKLLSAAGLILVFAVSLIVFAGLMQIPPPVSTEEKKPRIPPVRGMAGGLGVGILSTLMGIGGATLNVPFMTLHGIRIHNAVASSSALGPFIALPGALGFIVIGWNISGLPPFSLGYVNMAALLFIAPVSMMMAPFGAKAAHRLSVTSLRRVFALFLCVVAVKMIYEALMNV